MIRRHGRIYLYNRRRMGRLLNQMSFYNPGQLICMDNLIKSSTRVIAFKSSQLAKLNSISGKARKTYYDFTLKSVGPKGLVYRFLNIVKMQFL